MDKEIHLDIYCDRYELFQDNTKSVYYQGKQSKNTRNRYDKIVKVLNDGYLETHIQNIKDKKDFKIDENQKKTILLFS